MNSRERIQAALKFTNPDKVPIFDMVSGDLMPLPIVHSKKWKPGWNEGEEGLFPHVRGAYNWDRPDWAKENPECEGNNWKRIKHEEIDQWGCIWNMKGNDQDMGHPGRPSLPNWDDFENYISKYTPDATEETRYEPALQLRNMVENDRYFTLNLISHGPSQVVAAMRGFNTYLIDHKKHPKELKRALQVVADYHVDIMRYSKKYGLKADGIWVVDDLGEQKGPFFSARTFENLYEDSYRTIINEAHDLDLDVHLHCCGKIDPLLEPLIKWGLDAIELDSPRMSGYNDLRPYRGKIMFWGCVNIQSIYTQGTPDEVEREVWHMMRNLGTKNGGFGAYFYPTPRDLNTPRKNIKAFEKGLQKYGNYSKIPESWWEYPVSESWDSNFVPSLPQS
jgi:hypothetical protein